MESAPIITPNLFMFHIVTDNKWFYFIGMYIP
jgi:hypothetical protein